MTDFEKQAEALYPCAVCGVPRTKDQGGTVFTVCDDCWDDHYKNGNHARADVSGDSR